MAIACRQLWPTRFKAEAMRASLIIYFCRWLSPLFVFLGALFIANAVFNTLGRAHYSTLLNWGAGNNWHRAICSWPGRQWVVRKGALAGNMIGGVVFGVRLLSLGISSSAALDANCTVRVIRGMACPISALRQSGCISFDLLSNEPLRFRYHQLSQRCVAFHVFAGNLSRLFHRLCWLCCASKSVFAAHACWKIVRC